MNHHINRERGLDELRARDLVIEIVARQLVADVEAAVLRTIDLAPLYVQWAPNGTGLQVEVVSNRFLPRERWISVFGEVRMRDLGFRTPDRTWPNWTRFWDAAQPASDAAAALVDAMLDVYGVSISNLHFEVTESCPEAQRVDLAPALVEVVTPVDVRPTPTADHEIDTRAIARHALDVLECADRLELLAAGTSTMPPLSDNRDDVALLREAAAVLRREVPIEPLVEVGIADDDYIAEDLQWVLREHLAGRNPGRPEGPNLRLNVGHLRIMIDQDLRGRMG